MKDKNNAIIIQQVTSPKWGRMISLYFDRHVQYCSKFDMDYYVHIGEVEGYELDRGDIAAWSKLYLVQQALRSHDYAIWLDSDAFIWDMSVDLRQACLKSLNGVRWNYPMPHIQAGVLYFNKGGLMLASRLLEESKYYLAAHPTVRGWFEQGQLAELEKIPEWKAEINDLDWKWNWCSYFCPPIAKPVVISWHGVEYNTKMNEMREMLGPRRNVFIAKMENLRDLNPKDPVRCA